MLVQKPNLFLIGAQKSATTYLNQIFISTELINTGKIKEPNYFCRSLTYQKRNFDDYLSNYIFKKRLKYSLDSSTGYFQPNIPDKNIFPSKRVFAFSPNAKIFGILRNPVDRYESAYNHHILMGRIEPSEIIEKVLDKHLMVDIGKYSLIINQWKEYFKNLKFFLYDDLVENKKLFLQDIFEFLGMNVDLNKIDLDRRFNDTNIRMAKKKINKKAKLSEEARNELKDIYKNEVLELEGLINRDLSKWLL